MVWNRDWRVAALPSIMVVATGSEFLLFNVVAASSNCPTVSGYGAVGRYFATNPFTDLAIDWARGMLTVSMVTNLLLTLLTAGRIWYVRALNFPQCPS